MKRIRLEFYVSDEEMAFLNNEAARRNEIRPQSKWCPKSLLAVWARVRMYDEMKEREIATNKSQEEIA
jgi:hypothetical protein